MIKCEACGARAADNAEFCTWCGTKVRPVISSKNACRTCGAGVKPVANFCTSCGTPVEHAGVPAEALDGRFSVQLGIAELNAAAATPVGQPPDVLSSENAGTIGAEPALGGVEKPPHRRTVSTVVTIILLCVIGVGVYSMRSSASRVVNRTPEPSMPVQAPTLAAHATADTIAKGTEGKAVSDAAALDAQSRPGETGKRPQQEVPRVTHTEKQDVASKQDIAVTQPGIVRNAESPNDPTAAASPTARSLIAAAISGDSATLQRNIAQLQANQPARGDRKRARQLNDRGLALFQDANYTGAAEVFRQAHRADQGDAEIRENLGYALMQSEALAEAEGALLSALEIAPQRATAWGSLGHVYAKRGKHREAVALLLTAYRFAPDRKKALEVYARQAENEDDPNVRAMLAESVTRLSRTQEKARPPLNVLS